MSNSIEILEKELCAYFGRRYCFLTGRGAAAIYLALKALPIKTGKVVMPAIVCPSPPNAVLYAGFEPIFCDISLEDFNMEISSLKTILSHYDDVVAVMPVHLYGYPADMDAILELAKERGLYVIEDAAQAMGGMYKGRNLGSMGDLSVVSFGHTKILDAGWGGALLTDDPNLAERIGEELPNLPPCPKNIDAMYEEYRQVYYTIKPLTEINDSLNDLFTRIPFIYRQMYLFRLENWQADRIRKGMIDLEKSIQARKKNALEYRGRLRHPDIFHPPFSETCVPWRYSILLRKNVQKKITDSLRSEGIDASNWYPPLYQWYDSGKKQEQSLFKNADYLGSHIVNLWVEPSISSGYIDEACATLLHALGGG